MKFLITVIIATAIALTNADPLDPYETLAAECAAHEGATDDDIKQALALEMPSTKAGKCLNACIGETTGVMKDNKIDVETTIAMTKMDFSDDPETIKLVTAIASECADTTDEDRCEAAYKIILCTENAARARGLVA